MTHEEMIRFACDAVGDGIRQALDHPAIGFCIECDAPIYRAGARRCVYCTAIKHGF